MEFDLLSLVEQGGCSAKLPAKELEKALADLPKISHKNVLVDIETHDDGGVYKISDDYALIQTTDFFPPVCSDPYDFGQIAAANALSDVYAMGGQVLSALNLVLFPAQISLDILKEILRGGQDKVHESGGVILGGHTIADDIPKYGLAVTGFVHPDHVVTNSKLRPGDYLVLTKPIGTGITISAKRNGLAPEAVYKEAIDNMKLLNDKGAIVMNKYNIQAATDITGFGLLGHAKKMADGSKTSIHLNVNKVPVMDHVLNLVDMGCIPGAAFRNQEFCGQDCLFDNQVTYNEKMLLFDAQTSGGLLMSVPPEKVNDLVEELKESGYPVSSIVGEVSEKMEHSVSVSKE